MASDVLLEALNVLSQIGGNGEAILDANSLALHGHEDHREELKDSISKSIAFFSIALNSLMGKRLRNHPSAIALGKYLHDDENSSNEIDDG